MPLSAAKGYGKASSAREWIEDNTLTSGYSASRLMSSIYFNHKNLNTYI